MALSIFHQVAAEVKAGGGSWLVTVISTEGSTPGKIGMKMLVQPNGKIDGTIGGGAIEKRVITKIMQEKPAQAVKWNFDLGNNAAAEKTGMVCGGAQEVLVDPLFCGNDLYIIGAGHCGKALTEFAAKCDFRVTVFDHRPEFTLPEQHPHAAQVICVPYEEIEQHINFSPQTYIVVMTHGHIHDEQVMRKLLGKEYKYFGVIGSKTKAKAALNRLLKAGFARETLDQVFLPIGLKIGSQTPHEIAISILAQLIAVKTNSLPTS